MHRARASGTPWCGESTWKRSTPLDPGSGHAGATTHDQSILVHRKRPWFEIHARAEGTPGTAVPARQVLHLDITRQREAASCDELSAPNDERRDRSVRRLVRRSRLAVRKAEK